MEFAAFLLDELPLADVDAVVFYKRDEITADLICCDVSVAGRLWFFHEEAPVWAALVAHLSNLPGFRTDWFAAVACPPFATSETIAFERGEPGRPRHPR